MFSYLSIPILIINFKVLDKLKKTFLEVSNNFIKLKQLMEVFMSIINSIIIIQKLIFKVKFS
jgi:hypothetical protein